MVEINILYVDNCPNYTRACGVICDIIAEVGIDANIKFSKVHGDHPQFRGSPTVLVNGEDVEICFNDMHQISNTTEVVETIACRLYDCDVGRGCPSHEMVRCAIEKIVERE